MIRLVRLVVGLLVVLPIAMVSTSPASAESPTLVISPSQVSCTTPITLTGRGFDPGTEVVVGAGGPEAIPTSIFLTALGPYTVAADGTFSADVPPGLGIHECFGGPLGQDGAPFQFSARTIVDGPDTNGTFTLGAPQATGTFTFAVDPADPRLTLSPDHGVGCIAVTATGRNFRPHSYVSIYAGVAGGHTFGPAVDEPVLVDADGTFAVTLSPILTPFIDCEDRATVDGTTYLVTASTGRLCIDEDPDGPRAGDTFTVTLSAEQRFARTWSRTDEPVAEQQVARTWIWGPGPLTDVIEERYADSPDGIRNVQYYDKSRMEITHPDGDRSAPWYVTNGLLVVEMVEGRYQIGDTRFDPAPDPADIPIAGDIDGGGISYADIADFGLRDAPATPIGSIISRSIGNDGTVRDDERFSEVDVVAAEYSSATNHSIASVFWDFMQREAEVMYPDGSIGVAPLFEHPVYATGYPITEAYWSEVRVAGITQPVLWQCFERRCLTWTPGNDPGWQVESGNVGLHYLTWRYPNR